MVADSSSHPLMNRANSTLLNEQIRPWLVQCGVAVVPSTQSSHSRPFAGSPDIDNQCLNIFAYSSDTVSNCLLTPYRVAVSLCYLLVEWLYICASSSETVCLCMCIYATSFESMILSANPLGRIHSCSPRHYTV